MTLDGTAEFAETYVELHNIVNTTFIIFYTLLFAHKWFLQFLSVSYNMQAQLSTIVVHILLLRLYMYS